MVEYAARLRRAGVHWEYIRVCGFFYIDALVLSKVLNLLLNLADAIQLYYLYCSTKFSMDHGMDHGAKFSMLLNTKFRSIVGTMVLHYSCTRRFLSYAPRWRPAAGGRVTKFST
jgi:hypothetical protein